MPIPVCLPDGGKIAKAFRFVFLHLSHHVVMAVSYMPCDLLLHPAFSWAWMTLRHWLTAWHLSLGSVLPLVMDKSLGRGLRQSSRIHLNGSWAASAIPLTLSAGTSCHFLLLALLLWTLQPSGILCDFTVGFNNFLKVTLFLTRLFWILDVSCCIII